MDQTTGSPLEQSASVNPLPEPPIVSKETPLLHSIFIGPDGLRAGWRVAFYLIFFAALLTAMFFALKPLLHLQPRKNPTPVALLISEIESLIAAVVPAVVIARFERRPFGAYGLPRSGAFGKQFWIGVLWGLCAISLLLLSLRGFKVFSYGTVALHGVHILKFAAFWGLLFLLVGFFEEFFTRGYTQFTLAKGIGFWPAAVLLSCAFGALHLQNPGEAWVGALGAAFIALFFCLTLRRTGTLWFAIGMHASWDWGESFLYSVPDSGLVVPGHFLNSSFHGPRWLTGGSVGPEASVFVFVLITLMWVLFDRLYPRSRLLTTTQSSPGQNWAPSGTEPQLGR